MNITRDVIADLLPVYLAGEASADTRALVEEFIRTNPQFAALVSRQAASLPTVRAPLSRESELAALEKTRGLLRRRAYFLAFAIFFTLFAFSIRFDAHSWAWMWADTPILGVVFLALGAACAYFYGRTQQKLRGTNL